MAYLPFGTWNVGPLTHARASRKANTIAEVGNQTQVMERLMSFSISREREPGREGGSTLHFSEHFLSLLIGSHNLAAK